MFNAKSEANGGGGGVVNMTQTDRIRVRQPVPLNKIVGK